MVGFGVLLCMGGALLFLAGVVAIFRPLPGLKMGNRPRAVSGVGIAAVLSIIGLAVVAATVPPPAIREQQKQSAAAAADDQRRASEKAVVDATAQARLVKGQVDAFWIRVKEAQSPCEQRRMAAENELTMISQGRSDAAAAGAVAKAAETTCRDGAVTMMAVRPPPAATGALKKAFEDARQSCADSMMGRQTAMVQLGRMLDEGMSPATVAKYNEQSGYAEMGALRCIANVSAAGDKVGWIMPKALAAETQPQAASRQAASVRKSTR
ncbi:MAG: hypothetical protein JWP35_4462 [Caulobacter sp.]|nr:hypothetical protein [Caulobacter sp.]